MYTAVILLHSWLRWAVVVLGLLALGRAFAGWFGNKAWTPSDRRAGLLFTIAIDTQALLGLLLYFALSPLTTALFGNFGAAMRDRVLRFWAVEHLALGLLALAVAHATSVAARRASEHRARHRRAAIGYALVALLVLLAIPWPFRAVGRELFRLGG